MVWSETKTSLVRKLESFVPKPESLLIGKLDRNCRKLDVHFAKILNFHLTKFGASCTKIHKFRYRKIGWFGQNPKQFWYENWSHLNQNSKVYTLMGNWKAIVENWTWFVSKS